MKVPRLRFTVRRMMFMVAIVGLGSWAFARYRSPSPYNSGWWEAERELWRGDASIYCGGYRSHFSDFCNLDLETGLPYRDVYSCVVQAGDLERVKGHNDRIEQYIRWHGLPTNSLKPWEKQLFHLKHYFDVRTQNVKPIRLLTGGKAAVSPDGRKTFRLVDLPNDDGTPRGRPRVRSRREMLCSLTGGFS